jgi:hypothetical protein
LLATAAPTITRRNTSAEGKGRFVALTAEELVLQVDLIFRNAGIAASRSKVSRLVRTYKRRIEPNGFALIDYLANNVAMSEVQRRVVADELTKVIAYADPTGETAVRNVMDGVTR